MHKEEVDLYNLKPHQLTDIKSLIEIHKQASKKYIVRTPSTLFAIVVSGIRVTEQFGHTSRACRVFFGLIRSNKIYYGTKKQEEKAREMLNEFDYHMCKAFTDFLSHARKPEIPLLN